MMISNKISEKASDKATAENKAEKKFDEFQTAAIQAKNNSVVSAGAGSGKTTVLANRFLELLKPKSQGGSGFHVDEILTLTFTKKATVEMSSRIYKVLRNNTDPQIKKEAANFYKANIHTLDSYCNSVAKMGCNFYGISPNFTQDDDEIESQAKKIALPLILSNKENEGIKKIVSANKYEEIAEQLFINPVLKHSTIVEPLDFKKMLDFQIESAKEIWNENCQKATKIITDMKNIYENFDGDKTKANYQKVSETMIALPYLEIYELFSENSSRTCQIIELASKTKSPGSLKGFESFSDLLGEIKEIYPIVSSILTFKDNYHTIENLIPLLEQFQNEIINFKRNQGLLTFADISQIALLTLKEHPEIRQVEKEKYKAIMIDEFQDNNSLQRDMLFLLAEKKERNEKGVPTVDELESDKLFFVGDEKQSIYLFRGADVSVFRSLSSEFKNGNLEMNTNYRSEPALIASFNTIFGGFPYPLSSVDNNSDDSSVHVEKIAPSVFFTQDDGAESYEAVYHKVQVPQSKIGEAKEKYGDCWREKVYKPHIHFALYDNNQEKDEKMLCDEEAEAEWIARKIKQLVQTENKKISYNDIAILTRNYSLLPIYERTFLKHGIPYNSEAVKGLFSDGPINDIYSFLRICAYPNDKVAYTSLLKSPFVNLNLEQIQMLLCQKVAPFSENTELFSTNGAGNIEATEDMNAEKNVSSAKNISTVFDKNSLERFIHAKENYEELLNLSKTESLSNLVSKIWYDFGYRYETLWNKNVEMFSKMYDIIFELAHRCEEKKFSLAAFTDFLRDYKDENKKNEINVLLEQTEGVHIMSIHKSKGLEFPVVFVAATHKSSSDQENKQKVQYSKKYKISIKDISGIFYKIAEKENKAVECAELRRLTYVAITRAINEVYITNGKYSIPKTPKDYTPGNDLPDSIFDVLQPSYDFFKENENSYFDEEKIPQFPRFENQEKSQSNTIKAKLELQNEISKVLSSSHLTLIEKENIEPRYINASHLDEFLGKTSEQNSDAHSDEQNSDKENEEKQKRLSSESCEFQEIDKIVESTRQKTPDGKLGEPRFSYADFGTLAHAYLEATVKNKKVEKIEKLLVEISDTENEKRVKSICSICEKMAENFKNSKIGKEALSSSWKRSEFNFTYRVDQSTLKNFYPETKTNIQNEKIMNGSIDLIFQNDDLSYTIVDYKTDKEIENERHYTQLKCYRKVISEMMNCDESKIKCVLYYLRYNQVEDISLKL